MERTQSGLFALHIAEPTSKVPVVGLVGAYDPVEQLWRDDGIVVAHCNTDDLIGICIDVVGCDVDCCKQCCKAHGCDDIQLNVCL